MKIITNLLVVPVGFFKIINNAYNKAWHFLSTWYHTEQETQLFFRSPFRPGTHERKKVPDSCNQNGNFCQKIRLLGTNPKKPSLSTHNKCKCMYDLKKRYPTRPITFWFWINLKSQSFHSLLKKSADYIRDKCSQKGRTKQIYKKK